MALSFSGDELAAWVAESCARQGVPLKVTDTAVVSRMVTLLGSPDGRGGLGGTPIRPDRRGPSQAPHDLHSVRVQRPGSWGAGVDDHVIDDRPDDGALASEVEAGPLSA